MKLLSYKFLNCFLVLFIVFSSILSSVDVKANDDSKEQQNTNSETIMEALTAGINEFLGTTDEAINYGYAGSAIHPYASGTGQYVEEVRTWSCNLCDYGDDIVSDEELIMLKLIRINDVTQSDQIAGRFVEWEYYQERPNVTYQYHNGEFIIYIAVPEEYVEEGFSFEMIKEKLDSSYERTLREIELTEQIEEVPILKDVDISVKSVCVQVLLFIEKIICFLKQLFV